MMPMVRRICAVAAVTMTLMLAASPSMALSSTPSSSSPASSTGKQRTTATSTRQPQDVDDVHFLNPSVGWASEDNSARLLMTTDGGAHWRDVSPPMLRQTGFVLARGLAGGAFLSPADFWVSVFDLGPDKSLPAFVFHTTDGGVRWARAGSFPASDDQTWLRFGDDRQGWAVVGHGQLMGIEAVTVYETTSSGRRWSVISRSSTPSAAGTPGGPSLYCDKSGLSLSGTEASPILWLTGASGGPPCVARSTDGGRRWTDVGLPNPSQTDGGEAWPPVFSSRSNGALAVWYGTAHGAVTAVYSTTSGGATWVEHRLPSAKPGPMDVVSSTTWFAASGKTLYRTTNGGARWSRVSASVNFGNYQSPNTLDFVNTVDGWAVVDGQVWHTTDGGHVWSSKGLPI